MNDPDYDDEDFGERGEAGRRGDGDYYGSGNGGGQNREGQDGGLEFDAYFSNENGYAQQFDPMNTDRGAEELQTDRKLINEKNSATKAQGYNRNPGNRDANKKVQKKRYSFNESIGEQDES